MPKLYPKNALKKIMIKNYSQNNQSKDIKIINLEYQIADAYIFTSNLSLMQEIIYFYDIHYKNLCIIKYMQRDILSK